MKRTGIYKKSFISLFPIAIFCYVAIFLSLWNANLTNSHSYLIPLIFLFFGLLCIILIFFMVNAFLQPVADERKDELPSQNEKFILEQDESTDVIAEAMKSASDLLKGLSSGSDIKTIAGIILKNLALEFEMVQGMFFFLQKKDRRFHVVNTYAYTAEKDPPPFIAGEGLPGQAATDRKIIILKNLPDSYSPVRSGLGKGKPSFLYIIPVIHEDEVIGIIEMSTFCEIDEEQLCILDFFMKNAGNIIIQSLRKINE